ncbi:flavoprotein-like protein [Trametes elegans]|nr:flavoprotein-like protein [Trametes elegans]
MHKFDTVMQDPSYTPDIRQRMTIKPKGHYVHAVPRKRSPSSVAVSVSSQLVGGPYVPSSRRSAETKDVQVEPKQKLYVVYGSNTATSQTFALRIAGDAGSHGFKSMVGTLDSIAGHVPTDGPLVIVTASFEGGPADNAAHFFEWMQHLQGNELEGRIPKTIDKVLEERGSKRLHERGVGDALATEFFEAFDEWEAQLWKTLSNEYSIAVQDAKSYTGGIALKTIDSGTSRAATLRQPDADLGRVMDNRLLTSPDAPAKRHIEFQLPEHLTYRAGDYLAISALLSGYVEISQPATTRDVRILLASASSEATKATLADLSASHTDKVIPRRLSVLDVLEDHADLELPFGVFLEMLPPMRVRHKPDAPFLGVASNVLALPRPGDVVQLAVRAAAPAFHPPGDVRVPLVMLAAGPGLAPVRGFLQERAGRPAARATLFFGCRARGEDFLYGDSDLRGWEDAWNRRRPPGLLAPSGGI